MATTIERIAQEAAAMTRQERLTLVRMLLELDEPSKAEEIATAWEIEIRARINAVDEGRVTGIPYEEIQKEMAGRFGRQ
jgi:putative addiction module component (TIGR02574 family)